MLKKCGLVIQFSNFLFQANPSQFDQVEDLAILRYINESSALHALRQRYGSHLVHTAAGNNLLLLINPVVPLNIYSDKVIFETLLNFFLDKPTFTLHLF